jgi:anion-transporting  ArsA/GET3 family ATPase
VTSANAIDTLLTERHIIVCTGAGGVGKTTTSAALALRAADLGRRTVVCTIDPAKRLAQSMGLDALDNTAHRVEGTLQTERGELFAMMLDMKRTFDEMVLEMATPERAERILTNPFYRHLSSTLAGTQEYMAMMKLWELHEEGGWELIVVDTPPTRSALDFLDSPKRLTDFLEGRFLKMLMWPYMKAGRGGLRVLNFGTQVALRAVTRITGSELLGDVAAFFQHFEGMYEEFKNRAQRVRELLQARRTSFIVVTAPTEASLREARFFTDRLRQERMPMGGIVVNRAHPTPEVPALMTAAVGDGVLGAALQAYRDRRMMCAREEALLDDALAQVRAPIWRVPELDDEVTDLSGLRTVGRLIAGES